MTILTRYLLRQNLFLLLTILAAGATLYILTDLFERLDTFLEKGASAGLIVTFFFLKLPVIISQILPAAFLLAMVTQFHMLQRSREQIALAAGGISPVIFLRFILCYGLLWACGQFFFAQFLGVVGDRLAAEIWQVDIQGDNASGPLLKNRWLTNKNRLLHLGQAVPALKSGQDLLVYTLDDAGIGIEEILRAKHFTIQDTRWDLRDVVRIIPQTFRAEREAFHTLQIRQGIAELQLLTRAGPKASHLPFWELRNTIRRLEAAGSNVEALRTAWHNKLSYAASLVVMGLLAFVIARLTENIYKAIGLALILVFLMYSVNTFCGALGERGLTLPFVGAWFADGLFFVMGLLFLALPWMRRMWHT